MKFKKNITSLNSLIFVFGSVQPESSYTAEVNLSQETCLFSQSSQADFYWHALLQIAHNKKEQALKIIDDIKNNRPSVSELPWKQERPEAIDDFFDKFFLEEVQHDPQVLSYLGFFESIGVREHNAYLTNISPDVCSHTLERKKRQLEILESYSSEELSPDQKLSKRILSWNLEHALAGEKFVFHEYKLNQLDSPLVSVATLLTQFHRLADLQDFENYTIRIEQVPKNIKQLIEFLEIQKKQGCLPPSFSIKRLIENIEKSLPDKQHTHILMEHFSRHIANTDIAQKDALIDKMQKSLTEKLYPAYLALKDYLQKLLIEKQSDCGVWQLPDGKIYYEYLLKRHANTNLSAEEVHNLGLSEVKKIQKEMRYLLKLEGFSDSEKSLGELMQEFAQDPSFYYSNDELGRQQCLADYAKIVDRSRQELGPLFDLKPQAGVTIQAVPTCQAESAPLAYYCPSSMDGARPGTFFANVRNMTEVPKFGMETLTIHEAEPGHHFQIELQHTMGNPLFRKMDLNDPHDGNASNNNAYCEGWALYVEKLAYEQGFYSSNAAKLGHFQDELLRAVRLVVDTGIHYKQWTREQAIKYMEEQTGFHHDSVVIEVERYFVWPGQACGYKIGQLKILELRQRAKDALSDKFDIREFHDIILGIGSVPLEILEEVIDDYIAKKLLGK